MGCLKLTNYRQKLPRRRIVLCRDFRQKNTTNYNYQFDYDNIGNRITSSNNDITTNYSTNNLNQYETVGDFVPLFDADGNQTKIKTSKGEFLVEYNGENRPVKFTNLSDSTFITMKYDYMGRRGGKLHFNSQSTWTSTVKFFYKDYTLIEESTASNDVLKEFVWDPTAGQATKPLVFFNQTRSTILYYAHDANKNVTELVYNAVSSGMVAHYEYDTFGNTIVSTRKTPLATPDIRTENPFRFSSEYFDSELSLIYYNYRHYNPLNGRWISRDPIEEDGGYNLYNLCNNNLLSIYDYLGNMAKMPDKDICIVNGKGVHIIKVRIPQVSGKSQRKNFDIEVNKNSCEVVLSVRIYFSDNNPNVPTFINKIKELWDNKLKLCCCGIQECKDGLNVRVNVILLPKGTPGKNAIDLDNDYRVVFCRHGGSANMTIWDWSCPMTSAHEFGHMIGACDKNAKETPVDPNDIMDGRDMTDPKAQESALDEVIKQIDMGCKAEKR